LVDDEDYDDYDDDDYVDEFDDENFVKSNEAKNEQPRKLPERRKVRKYLYKWHGTSDAHHNDTLYIEAEELCHASLSRIVIYCNAMPL
jgi:hypothetical protein